MDNYALVAAALSGSFILSAVLKLIQPAQFRTFLDSLIRHRLSSRALAVGIPALELTIGVLLLTPATRVGAVGALIMSAGFLFVGFRAVRRSDSPGCGCFGGIDTHTPPGVTLGRAIVVTAAALYAVALSGNDGVGGSPAPEFIVAVGLLCGAGLALTMTLAGQIVEFRRTLRPLLIGDSDSPSEL